MFRNETREPRFHALARDFPAEYERYRRAVRWRIVPFIY